MIGLQHYLTISAVLFALAVAGIFINRRNLILLLMCIELMLLAVNFNFIAFSRYLGDETGQVFVFFILTVAAAEAAIGLAILVVLFRNRRSINVQELDSMKLKLTASSMRSTQSDTASDVHRAHAACSQFQFHRFFSIPGR